MEKINVGIIGCGCISDLHFLGYKDSKEARIYAVCDLDSEVAEARKSQWKAEKSYTDFKGLLSDPNIDAVEILTPHRLHEPMVIEAARANKHIAVQKPMTISLDSAKQMLAETKKAEKIYKVTEPYAFYPPIALAKNIIDSGEIGEPIGIRIKFIGGTSGGWKVPASCWEWRIKDNAENQGMRGLQTFDHGHHLWSTAWFLLGDVERVASWIDYADGIIDCPSVIMWKYKDSKKYGVCEYAQAADLHIPSKYYTNDEWFEITGNRGIIFIHRCTGNIHEGPGVSLFNGKGWKHYTDVKTDWAEGFIGATNNFIGSIQGREAPLLSGDQGYEILRFSLAIQRAARLRREVYLDEMDKRFPSFYTWRRKRMEKKETAAERISMSLSDSGKDLSKYAPQARSLTEQLMNQFNPDFAKGWESVIGLHLEADGGIEDEMFGLFIKEGKAILKYGDLPEDARFILRLPAGTWAAILSGKERLEEALLQGKIKMEGQAEEGLKLRAAFQL